MYHCRGSETERHCDRKPAGERRQNGKTLGFPDSHAQTKSVVVADNRLRRLRYGIAYHEHKRAIIASYAEGSHTVIAHVSHEYDIAHKHKNAHCRLAEQCGYSYFTLVTDITQCQHKALGAEFQLCKTQSAGKKRQIRNDHNPS